jgi:hypothetical protein
MTSKNILYTYLFRAISNIEAHDPYFSKNEHFELTEGELTFKFERLQGGQRVSKSITVIPRESSEHTFEPATFSY